MIILYIDGASLGNPGEAGTGVVVYEEKDGQKKVLLKKGYYIGKQTNNFAEYAALLFGLTELLPQADQAVTVYSDSELLCRQLQGIYKVKHENLIFSFNLAKELLRQFREVAIHHIPREQNREADALSKKSAESKKNIQE